MEVVEAAVMRLLSVEEVETAVKTLLSVEEGEAPVMRLLTVEEVEAILKKARCATNKIGRNLLATAILAANLRRT